MFLQAYINYNQQIYKHADLYPSRIKKDEDDVQSILKTINESFIDPFNDLGLLSISSGVIAMSKVETDCLSANQYGKKAMEKFISCDATHSLFDPMKKQKLSTFTNINCKVKDKMIPLQSSKELLSKIAMIMQTRKLDLRNVFQYPLGPLPESLAEPIGTLTRQNIRETFAKI